MKTTPRTKEIMSQPQQNVLGGGEGVEQMKKHYFIKNQGIFISL